jgi:8-oxo-dGTP diphosphatase
MIRKDHPQWQAGKLNGVGGKCNAGESLLDAMKREFGEEAGIYIDTWELILTLRGLSPGDGKHFQAGDPFEVGFFRSFGYTHLCKTKEQEPIEIIDVASLATRTDIIPNLRWIVPLCAHRHDRYAHIPVSELPATSAQSDYYISRR